MNATSVEFNRFLIDENGMSTTMIEFGSIYFGQSKEIEAYFINNTPKKFYFTSKIRKGLQTSDYLSLINAMQTPAEVGIE